MPKYKNPTVEDYVEMVRKANYTLRSDGNARMLSMLADEVARLRNEVPCPRCSGTGLMCTGDVYAGGPPTHDVCDMCKKHRGMKYPPMKRLIKE